MICFKCNKKTDNVFRSENNTSVYVCEKCLSSIQTNVDSNTILYRKVIEELIQEFGKLVNMAEKASTTNKNKLPLKVRKQSIYFRDCLKRFRQVSLDHEKYINNK